jgi:acetyl-CoA carboxylase beta subunit
MTNTELETTIGMENDNSALQIGEQQQQQDQNEREENIEHEIECPQCHDIMTLRSDFDNLYYCCEECDFMLYTIKRNL